MKPKTKTINVMLLDGGLGDHIASTTAVYYITQQYPWINPIVWAPDFIVEYMRNVLPGTEVWGLSEMRGRYDPTKPTKTTKWDGLTSSMKIHLVDYAFLKLCDESPSIEHKNYRQPNLSAVQVPELPEKYVVFTTGYTAEVREWPAESVNEVAIYILNKGYIPVFLGQTQTHTGVKHVIKGQFKEEIDFDTGVNLIDKTSLLQAMAIMSKARAVLGVDNGLLHAAGCTNVPIIGGFTTVTPEIRMPYRGSVLGKDFYPIIPQSLDCRFCQQKTNFLYGHDYRNCLFKDERALQCTKEMKDEHFISYLEKIL